MYYCTVFMCAGVSCQTRNSVKLKEYLKEEIEKRKLNDYIRVYANGCLGTCQKGPSMVIVHETLGLVRYVHVDNKEVIDDIIDKTLINGELIKEHYIEKHERED